MIGIFDSGIGGLTVVREIRQQLPGMPLVYFGDTARTPYGNKSRETIVRYAREDAQFLLDQGATVIVIACNTASAVAAEDLKKAFPNTPIFEVITPAIDAAKLATKSRRIGVIGTRATVESGIYQKLLTHDGHYQVFGKACPLFVPLAEEGWLDQPITKMVARKYLHSMKVAQIDTLILGCTHYPLLKPVIQAKVGRRITLVDPAHQTALELKKYLNDNPSVAETTKANDASRYYFSDLPPHLSDTIRKWLGEPVKPERHVIG